MPSLEESGEIHYRNTKLVDSILGEQKVLVGVGSFSHNMGVVMDGRKNELNLIAHCSEVPHFINGVDRELWYRRWTEMAYLPDRIEYNNGKDTNGRESAFFKRPDVAAVWYADFDESETKKIRKCAGELAQLLRQYHEATVKYNTQFSLPHTSERQAVIDSVIGE